MKSATIMKLAVLSLALATGLCFGIPAHVPLVRAQSLSIGVTPSFAEVEIDAGDDLVRTLTVSNEGDAGFAVEAAVTALPAAPDDRSAIPWLTVEPDSFELEAGETVSIDVEIEVPENVAAGGYYAQITLATNAGAAIETGIAVTGQVSAPFLLAVDGPGDVTISADVEQVTAVLEPDGRIGFRAEVTNTGNRHLLARGRVEVLQDDDTSVGEVDFPNAILVLPGETIPLTGQRSLLLEDGQSYQAVAEVDIGPGEPTAVEIDFTAAAPPLTIEDLRVCTDDSGAVAFRFTIENEGDIAVRPAIQLQLLDASGLPVSTLIDPDSAIVFAGSVASYSFTYSDEPAAADFLLDVRVRAGASTTIDEDVAFNLGSSNLACE